VDWRDIAAWETGAAMYDWVVLGEWVEIAVRWLHVITAMAWIGSSFYFIALDLGLHRDRNLASGADGEEWQVHGGGFYHVQKYLVAPAAMPEHLVWFKWESYTTWLSGFALLVLVYYLGADLYLIDVTVRELLVWQAVGISLASLAFGWVAYNSLCKVFVNADQNLLMLALFVELVLHPGFRRSGGDAASGGVHGVDHDGERVLRHHAEPARGGG
jgi:uncharacterized membrane protein